MKEAEYKPLMNIITQRIDQECSSVSNNLDISEDSCVSSEPPFVLEILISDDSYEENVSERSDQFVPLHNLPIFHSSGESQEEVTSELHCLNRRNLPDERNAQSIEIKSISSKLTQKKKFECSMCGKHFGRQARLNAHMTLHTGIKGHKCIDCPKSFATGWDLTMHRKLHSLELVCEVCNRPFTCKTKLERHRRFHTGEKPFQCDKCGKLFSEKRNMSAHLMGHHPLPEGRRPFRCVFCPSSFTDRSTLQQHFDRLHNSVKPPKINCPICFKGFKWRTNYNRHYKTHKKEELLC